MQVVSPATRIANVGNLFAQAISLRFGVRLKADSNANRPISTILRIASCWLRVAYFSGVRAA
jgi:hypothetical protein